MLISPNTRRRFDQAIVLVVSMALIGCSSLTTVPADAGIPRLAIGDEVRVEFKDGRDETVKVQELLADGFAGETAASFQVRSKIRVRYAEIADIERRRFSVLKTTGLILAIIMVAGLGAAAVGPGFPPPP